jgi:para-nitrobenzyl esterase
MVVGHHVVGVEADELPAVVATTSGSVRGRSGNGAVRFLGIPYSAPPVGPGRFRAPTPAAVWEGVRDCTKHGPICPQMQMPDGLSPVPDLSGYGMPMAEDCLNLNIYTPGVDDGRRPTAVWIHGGAFVAGSSAAPLYDGTSFARDDVVFVSINYRLHALGFLYLDELFGAEGSGNCGLLDQVAALEWVRDNIAAFGGDPDNVTIFGESAGGMSVGTLLGLPAAKGLFRRAIARSGAAHHNLSTASADRVARRVLQQVGVAPGDWPSLLELPTAPLMKAAQRSAFMEAADLLGDEHLGVRTVFAPVIDGSVLPVRAIDAIAAGASDGVDALIGTCADEYRLFIWGMPEALRNLVATPDVAAYFLGTGHDAEAVLRTYAAERPAADPVDLAAAVAGDAVFGIPAVRLAEAKAARGDNVWMQQLAWPTPVLNGVLGACHGLDLPFLFDALGYPGFVGENPPQALADDMHGACVRFIRDGDPNGGRLPTWDRYDAHTRAVMRFGHEPAVAFDPNSEERRWWDGSW